MAAVSKKRKVENIYLINFNLIHLMFKMLYTYCEQKCGLLKNIKSKYRLEFKILICYRTYHINFFFLLSNKTEKKTLTN